jgi:hypothetical protein
MHAMVSVSYDSTSQLKKLTAMLKKIIDKSQDPDPGEQLRRALVIFYTNVIPDALRDRRDLDQIEREKGKFVYEMAAFWFNHAYDGLLKQREAKQASTKAKRVTLR